MLRATQESGHLCTTQAPGGAHRTTTQRMGAEGRSRMARTTTIHRDDSEREPDLWVALAQVRRIPGRGALMDRNEAYVNVAAPATSLEQFMQAVSSAAEDIGFQVMEIEDQELYEQRRQEGGIPPEIQAIANQASRTNQVAFGSFFTWVSESDA